MVRLVQCKLIMNDDRNLGQLHFACLWDFPSSWTMIGFPFSASPSMSCNSVAESSVSTMVLVIDMNHTCLRIRSWTDLASYPKIFAKLTLQSCMLGGLPKDCLLTITKLLFFIFLGDKKETHMHTLCVPSPSKKLLCVYVLMCFPHTLVHLCSFSKKWKNLKKKTRLRKKLVCAFISFRDQEKDNTYMWLFFVFLVHI